MHDCDWGQEFASTAAESAAYWVHMFEGSEVVGAFQKMWEAMDGRTQAAMDGTLLRFSGG